ncbi:MAG: hypothetical protein CMC13_06955 [Flavobacteriaceae bacterium]|nr:hypothetical protein [Flavobacteriaceae bacterium]|tara:strand:- start:7138 stop:8085 length:948 start_codon:yes stop_codon:yes gene_type:complete
MKSIVLIVPYLGKWPLWFDAHLVSIARNPTINWLFITDCKIPDHYPENVRFIHTTSEALNFKINECLNIQVPLSPRKLCDIRPAYGKVFQEYILDYDFWGFCDVDIIWGNIRKFLTKEMLLENDIISSRKNTLSGHFTVLRNSLEVNSLYMSIPNYLEMLSIEPLMRIDEEAFTLHLKNLETQSKFKIWWEAYLMNNVDGKAHQEYYLDKWLWKEGKMLELKDGPPIDEVMYLHFINWKRTMKYCEVNYKDNPKQFYISYSGIHYKTHSVFIKMCNRVKNLFDGYSVQQNIRIKKLKFRSLIKRIKRKIRSTFYK